MWGSNFEFSFQNLCIKKMLRLAGHQWLIPAILGTWEAEIWRIEVQGQPGQTVPKIPSPK
jgi:hypothetical protein